MKTETLKFNTANGEATAYVAAPANADVTTKAVVLIQEWWGLNDHIKDIANRYANEGFIAIAPDLYRGRLAKTPEEAGKMMNGLAIDDGLNTIESAMDKARATYGIGHFGISGFCMGGTYALRAACELEGIAAAAPFYGDVPEEDVLSRLKTPTLFVSGIHDKWINPEKVAGLENIAQKYGLPVKTLKYDADHAFFNNTRPAVFNEPAANDVWAQVIAFFNEHL